MDLIDRKKLIEELQKSPFIVYNSTLHIIENAPTVDAVSVVHGHWEIDKETGEYICSECGKDTCGYLDMEDEFFYENGVKGFRLTQPNYCKHCGAKMDEDIKSTENGKNC